MLSKWLVKSSVHVSGDSLLGLDLSTFELLNSRIDRFSISALIWRSQILRCKLSLRSMDPTAGQINKWSRKSCLHQDYLENPGKTISSPLHLSL